MALDLFRRLGFRQQVWKKTMPCVRIRLCHPSRRAGYLVEGGLGLSAPPTFLARADTHGSDHHDASDIRRHSMKWVRGTRRECVSSTAHVVSSAPQRAPP